MESKYLILLTIISAAIAVYGIITMQLLMAALLVGLVVLVGAYIQYRRTPQQPGSPDEGLSTILLAAVIAGIFSLLHLEFLLWAVALAALFLIQQSLARIEKRLANPEKP